MASIEAFIASRRGNQGRRAFSKSHPANEFLRQHIKDLMKENDWTLSEIADGIGVQAAHLCAFLKGKIGLSWWMGLEFCEKIGLDAGDVQKAIYKQSHADDTRTSKR